MFSGGAASQPPPDESWNACGGSAGGSGNQFSLTSPTAAASSPLARKASTRSSQRRKSQTPRLSAAAILQMLEGSFRVGLSDKPGAVRRAGRDFFIAAEEDITVFAIYVQRFSAVYQVPALTVDALGRRGNALVDVFRTLFLQFKKDPLTTRNLGAILRLSRPAQERRVKERLGVFFGGFRRTDYQVLVDWYVKQLARLNSLMVGAPGFSTITADDCCNMVFRPGARILSERLVSSLAELSAEADAVDRLLSGLRGARGVGVRGREEDGEGGEEGEGRGAAETAGAMAAAGKVSAQPTTSPLDSAPAGGHAGPANPAGAHNVQAPADVVLRLADEIEGSKAYFRDRCISKFRGPAAEARRLAENAEDCAAAPSLKSRDTREEEGEDSLRRPGASNSASRGLQDYSQARSASFAGGGASLIQGGPSGGTPGRQPAEVSGEAPPPPQPLQETLQETFQNPLLLSAQPDGAGEARFGEASLASSTSASASESARRQAKTLRDGEPFETEYSRFLFLTSGRTGRSPRARSPWGTDTMWKMPAAYVQQRECNLIRRSASAEPRGVEVPEWTREWRREQKRAQRQEQRRSSCGRNSPARPSSAGWSRAQGSWLRGSYSGDDVAAQRLRNSAPTPARSPSPGGRIQDAVVRSVIKFADDKRDYYMNFLERIVEFLNLEADLCSAAGVGSGLSEQLGRGVFLAGLGQGGRSGHSASGISGEAASREANTGGAPEDLVAARLHWSASGGGSGNTRPPPFTVVGLAESLAVRDYASLSLVSQPLAEIARLRCDLASSITTITNLQLLLQRAEAENAELKSRASRAHIEGKQSALAAAAKDREAAALRHEADGLRGALEGLQAKHAVEKLRGQDAPVGGEWFSVQPGAAPEAAPVGLPGVERGRQADGSTEGAEDAKTEDDRANAVATDLSAAGEAPEVPRGEKKDGESAIPVCVGKMGVGGAENEAATVVGTTAGCSVDANAPAAVPEAPEPQ